MEGRQGRRRKKRKEYSVSVRCLSPKFGVSLSWASFSKRQVSHKFTNNNMADGSSSNPLFKARGVSSSVIFLYHFMTEFMIYLLAPIFIN